MSPSPRLRGRVNWKSRRVVPCIVRRLLGRAAVLLVIAVVLNLAVAWGCALGSGVRWSTSWPPTGDQQRWWEASAPPGVSAEPMFISRMDAWGLTYEIFTGVRREGPVSATPEFKPDGRGFGLGIVKDPASGALYPWDQAVVVRAGWPVAVLQGARWWIGAPEQINYGGPAALVPAGQIASGELVYASALAARGAGRERLIPFRPRWAGLAAGSAGYAAVMALTLGVFGAARRAIRRRRHGCPACGYPIGSSPVCTECGGEVPVSSAP